MKFCSRCKLTKDLAQFAKLTSAPDGLQYYCRKCKSELHQEHHTARMLSIKDSKVRRVERNRHWGLEYLKSHPCACGEADIRVLEWDHDDPALKHKALSELILDGASIASLEREAAKCTVRCVRCHRLRTIEQFGCWIGKQALVA